MKAPAFLQKLEGATGRAERESKTLSAPPRPGASVPDPIDEQIAALLESVSPRSDTRVADSEPEADPVRVAPEKVLTATAPAEAPRPRRQARTAQTRTTRRPRRPVSQVFSGRSFELRRPYLSYSVRHAFAGLAYALPRPYLSYTVRRAFWWMAILLFSVAAGFLLVYLMST
jgi:hypothetical protein